MILEVHFFYQIPE